LAEPAAHRAQVPAGAEVRATAARAVRAVREQGRSLTDFLAELPPFSDDRDRALVQELSFGTLRLLPRLEALRTLLTDKPPRPDIGALILIGLYQLAETRVPSHAAVAATVAAARTLGQPRAAGLVNAVLRRYLRERETLEERAAQEPGVPSLFPLWLEQAVRRAWPTQWRDILAASNARPPMSLRVNTRRVRRSAYADRLAAAGLVARPIAEAPAGLMLDAPVAVVRLPGFADGLVSVQDGGAQLAAELLDAQPGEAVLDACAAPGGKAAHILERSDDRVALTALDSDPQRLALVEQNLRRLGVAAETVVADASVLSGDWAKRHYRRILLDVPCSATGVIRRHPDIKWLRRATDLSQLCRRQADLLDATWPLLEPGGVLLYTTCSLLPPENEEQIAAFLERHHDAAEQAIGGHWGHPRVHGRQTLPRQQGPDGFFYARLRKVGP